MPNQQNETEPESLKLATRVYDGLFEEDIDGIEQIALNRNNFFGTSSTN